MCPETVGMRGASGHSVCPRNLGCLSILAWGPRCSPSCTELGNGRGGGGDRFRPTVVYGGPVGHWYMGLEILGTSVDEATGEASSTRLVPKAIGEDVMAQRKQAA